MHHQASEGWSALAQGKKDWRAGGVVCSRTEGREGRGASPGGRGEHRLADLRITRVRRANPSRESPLPSPV
jgi:hypothetical protein